MLKVFFYALERHYRGCRRVRDVTVKRNAYNYVIYVNKFDGKAKHNVKVMDKIYYSICCLFDY